MIKIAKYLIPSGLLCCILFSSCLKDTPFVDVSNTAPIIEFGLSPTSGYGNYFNFQGDTLNGPALNYDTAIGLVIASPQVLNQAVTVTFALDPTQLAAINANPNLTAGQTNPDTTIQNPGNFTMLPGNYFNLAITSLVIPAGHRVGRIPVTLNVASLPKHHAYALPILITGAKQANGDTLIVSANASQFGWYFLR
jgi:uncharacterized protein DUF1735